MNFLNNIKGMLKRYFASLYAVTGTHIVIA